MTSDLDHFHESALYNSNVSKFCQSLPNHLRREFENSIHVDLLWGNVLGGYRGPANMQSGCSGDSGILPPSYGLTEIKFWWRMRTWISILTLGTDYGVQKALGHLEWSSLYFDSKTGECLSHDKNEAAEKLNEKGNELFEGGKYTDAQEYYSNALNNCNNSRQCRIYEANRQKAQDELNAINLCLRADNLFEQERYSEALFVYQEAYDKSQVTKQRNTYNRKKDKVQNIINILTKLETLWQEAWDVENDNQSDEANQIFQEILSESKSYLNTYRNDSKLKHYQTVVTLKIKGNEMFNQGLESQQIGDIFFEDAQELKQQEKYESAKEKLEEAKNYFRAACEKFEEGRKIDQRFSSCIAFVQEQINDVVQSIKFTEQSCEQYKKSVRMSNMDINIAETNRADVNSLEFHENEKQCIYIQQI